MQRSFPSRAVALAFALACAQQARAQVFVDSPGNIPQGAPFNSTPTEQAAFADIDLDGDWDCAGANGGDCCNVQNRLWINLGGIQGGTIGFFADETDARAPAVLDQTRDLEFVDFDSDGDPDVYVVNTAQLSNQGGRWWTNQGGAQPGNAGYFVDETAARWIGVGGAGSSVAPSLVLPEGNYVTYTQEQDFADVDADGDLDLIATPVGQGFSGKEPTRIFRNDGQGFFSEFNPSGFQLAGLDLANGDPALWCEGVQQPNTSDLSGTFADIAVDCQELVVGDVDGDLDVDLLLVGRGSGPRLFHSRLSETGTPIFRDMTGFAWPEGHGGGTVKYDSELVDLDGDDDLDVYGLNWIAPFLDPTLRNEGNGRFVDLTGVPGSQADQDACDVVDYDSDGDLDVYVAKFSGADKLFGNHSSASALQLAEVPDAFAPSILNYGLGTSAVDVDADGDGDLMRAGPGADHLLLNLLDLPDEIPPRVVRLEQPPDHAASGATPIRVQVYDNTGADRTGWATQTLDYSLDGGPFQSVAMTPMGGQVHLGALPASAVGNVRYFARSTDENDNSGVSSLKSIDTSGGCSGQVATYCTAKLNSDGCVPAIVFEGAPRVGGPTSFLIRGTDVLANANGLLIYSKVGPNNAPFHGGVLCVGAGLLRTPGQNSGGTGPCGGTLSFDFNAWAGLGSDPALVPGQKVWAQYWYRDVASPGGNGLTNGVTFTLCP